MLPEDVRGLSSNLHISPAGVARDFDLSAEGHAGSKSDAGASVLKIGTPVMSLGPGMELSRLL